MNSFFCTIFAFMSLASCTVANNIKGSTYTLIEPKYSTEITLGFDKLQDRYFGKVVNSYFGNYTLNKNEINFLEAGSTKMMGDPKDMESEYLYFKALQGKKNAEIQGDKLILKDAVSTLTFKKK